VRRGGRMSTATTREEQRRRFFEAKAQAWSNLDFEGAELPRLERLRARLGDLRGTRIYEPGCGCGRLLRRLVEWVGPQGRVVAVDSSPRMAEAAAAALAATGAGCGEVHCADFLSYMPSETELDLVLFFCVLPHLEDPARAISRGAALLRPGGRLVIAHLMGRAGLDAMHGRTDPAVRHDRMPDLEVLRQAIQDAGLSVREVVDTDEEFYLEAVKG